MSDDDEPPSHTRSLIALLAIVALLGAGWLVAQRLTASSHLEDCLMQGRHNCMPIDPSSGATQPPK